MLLLNVAGEVDPRFVLDSVEFLVQRFPVVLPRKHVRVKRPQWLDVVDYHRLLGYNRGGLQAEELLQKAGGSKWNECEANYFIALDFLGEGDRLGARRHFKKSVDTHVYHYFAYQWSRAFLTRMDNDSSWPLWIEVARD